MPWLPQTTAPVEERVKVLQTLVRGRPEAGWRLLVGLTAQPAGIFDAHISAFVAGLGALLGAAAFRPPLIGNRSRLCHLLVEQLGDDIERWKALIQQFENLPVPVQKEFLDRLSGFAERALDEETRRVISETIREKISLHRKFADTNWALQADVLTELESVRNRFEPDDAIQRNAWLFRPRWQPSETPEGEAERLETLCPQALREILDAGGWQDVLRLVEVVEAPEEVGSVLAAVGFAESDANILPELLAVGRREGCPIRRRIRKDPLSETRLGLGQSAGDGAVGPQRRSHDS